jgi:catechol 2,3-dioxygenase
VLGFGMSECIGDPRGDDLLSALLFRMSKDVGGQEIAVFRGPRFGLHHIAFSKEDPCDILIDGQFLAQARVPLDALGPHRQSYGKMFSLYFHDPAGLRLELCAGGRITEVHPEFEPVVWDETSLLKAVTFYDERMSEGLLEACC